MKPELKQVLVTNTLAVETYIAGDGLIVPAHEALHWLALKVLGYEGTIDVNLVFPEIIKTLHQMGVDVRGILMHAFSESGAMGSVMPEQAYLLNASDLERYLVSLAPYITEAVLLTGIFHIIVNHSLKTLLEKDKRAFEKYVATYRVAAPLIALSFPLINDLKANFGNAAEFQTDITKIATIAFGSIFDQETAVNIVTLYFFMFLATLITVSVLFNINYYLRTTLSEAKQE